jgi:hypothetical protein
VAKVSVNGELFDFDGKKCSITEALAIEDAYKRRYGEWQEDLVSGSAKAMAVMAWLIWRRDGRDVEFGGILSGEVELDLAGLLRSFAEANEAELAAQAAAEAEAAKGPNPMPAGLAPAGTPTTGTATSSSSQSKTSKRSSTMPKST